MAQLFYNHCGRIFVVLVLLFDLVVTQGNNNPSLPNNQLFYRVENPNDPQTSTTPRPLPQGCGNGRTYCEDAPDYPSIDDVNAELAKKYYPPINDDEPRSAAISAVDNGQSLCTTNKHTIFPKVALDIKNEWHFVLNTPTYRQGLEIDTCQQDNGRCLLTDQFVFGYETFCKQMYTYRVLVGLGVDGTELRQFAFPSTCCCVSRFIAS